MIGLDTHILVRFLSQDDPRQTALANRALAGLTVDNPGFVAREVLVELVWVLERAYRLPRARIADALQGLLAAVELEVEAADDAGRALGPYRDDGFDFPDLMIAAAARRAGCGYVLTLDHKAARIPGVTLLQA